MKFHWGHGIALFYTTFAVVMITAVIRSTAFDNSLVTEDYYAQDIAYQTTLNSQQNSRQLLNPLQLDQKGNAMTLRWPIEETGRKLSGTIKLYSPVSNSRDLSWPVRIDADGVQSFQIKDTPRGYYRIIVHWSDGKRTYLDEFKVELKSQS